MPSHRMEVGGKFAVSNAVGLKNSKMFLLHRMGEKNPSFPWSIIQMLLLENEVKLESVSVHVNGCLLVSGGNLVEEFEKLFESEGSKKEIK